MFFRDPSILDLTMFSIHSWSNRNWGYRGNCVVSGQRMATKLAPGTSEKRLAFPIPTHPSCFIYICVIYICVNFEKFKRGQKRKWKTSKTVIDTALLDPEDWEDHRLSAGQWLSGPRKPFSLTLSFVESGLWRKWYFLRADHSCSASSYDANVGPEHRAPWGGAGQGPSDHSSEDIYVVRATFPPSDEFPPLCEVGRLLRVWQKSTSPARSV